MQLPGPLLNLAMSFLLVSAIFYGVVYVPADLDGGETMLWTLISKKGTRALSITAEYLGLGNRVLISRSLAPWLSINLPPEPKPDVLISNGAMDGVPVRFYVPTNVVPKGPSLLWIHGGGWVTSSPESNDGLMSELAAQLNIKVVSIRYRLSPEHPFPAAFDDCLTVSRYFLRNAAEFDIDGTRVAIAGSSAGGNLAAAVSLKLRDEEFRPTFKLQVLTVPCLQAFDLATSSYQLNTNDPFLPKDWMVYFWLLYGVGDNTTAALHRSMMSNLHTTPQAKRSAMAQHLDTSLLPRKYLGTDFVPGSKEVGDPKVWAQLEVVISNPYFAPLMARSLSALPEAYILTVQYDVLRDDGLLYAKRLSKAGVRVTHKHYDHCNHCCLCHYNLIETSRGALRDLVQFLATNF